MSQRFVFLIDADNNLNTHLVGELARYGFRVEAATDSNELMQRKDDLPQLIVLCIDPKRTGWAVCNRLRKSMTLKSTPLIITSAEATEKDFDDHKKLKTRAEEYLHKPFAVEALVEKIGGLVGMPDPVDANSFQDDEAEVAIDMPMEPEEMAIEDENVILEEHEAEPLYSGPEVPLYGGAEAHNTNGFAADEEDRTRIGVMNIDGEVDMETEAAFAAIGMDEQAATDATNLMEPEVAHAARGRMTALPSVPTIKKAAPAAPAAAPHKGRNGYDEVPLDEPFGEDDPFSASPPEPSPLAGAYPAPLPPAESAPIFAAAPPPAAPPAPPREVSESIDLGLEDVARQAAREQPLRARPPSQPRLVTSARTESSVVAPLSPLTPVAPPTPAPPTASAGDTVAHDTNGVAMIELQRERDQLKRDVEELQKKLSAKPADTPPAPASSGFSREREFLNLREVINKKEKEVLDLRDALDGKERTILDGKDRLREAERKVRDLDERALTTERELVTAKEKIDALASDKERSVERERQVKARLEDALKTVSKYEQEVETWRAKHAGDVGAAEQRYNDAVAKHQAELADTRQKHEELREVQEAEHAAQLQKTVDAHEEDKALLVGKHDEERGRMEAEHAEQLDKLRESAKSEREGQKARYEAQLAELARQHESTVAGMRDEHEGTVSQLKQEHANTTAEKDQLHADELAGLKARQIKDTKEAERRHQDELAGLHDGYKRELQAAEERRQSELAAKAEEHRGELEALAQDHTEERQRLEADHVTAMHTLDERRQSELREAAEAHAAELERQRQEQEQRLADELKSARDQHMRKMQALEESHADLKAGMQQRHAQQMDELKAEHGNAVSELEGQVAERDRLIGEGLAKHGELESQVAELQEQGKLLVTRVGELEGKLKQAMDDINAREVTLNERATRISELEQESAGYQDQILKAYQRIKSDESIVSRAKKALAIALTLLDESAPDGGDEASS